MIPSLSAEDSVMSEGLSLQDALEAALANNQGLAGTRLQAEAMGAVPSQQGALRDCVIPDR